MSIWEIIHQAVADRIEEQDKAFELAFLRFGGARAWLVDRINLSPDWSVLEIGYGQGYLSVELASSLTRGKVIGVDLLNEDSTAGATRWIAKRTGVWDRIALASSDSMRLPFRDGSFDAVVSFLALQDIKNTRGDDGLLATLDEACRTVKHDGVIGFADDSFPSSRPNGDQGKIFDAIKRYWHNLLPPVEGLIERMKANGISDAKAFLYDPAERLLPNDAERELRLSTGWVKQIGVMVDFANFWKEVGESIKKYGRAYSKVALLLGTKTKRR